MTPLNTIILADDVNEPVRRRAEGVAVDELANAAIRCDRARVMLERFKRESAWRVAHADCWLSFPIRRFSNGIRE